MGGEQTMALGSDIANLEHHAVAQFALNSEVVLTGVLGAQVGFEFAVEKDRTEQGQIRWLAFGRCDNAAERIRACELALIYERRVEKHARE